jgi:hypothetical protein
MNIARLNDIFTRQGPVAALASARAAQMPSWVINKLENGTWEPGAKSEPKPAPQPKRAPLPAMRKLSPRVGKTARDGGLAASMQRKKARSAADRELRAKMQTAGKGK